MELIKKFESLLPGIEEQLLKHASIEVIAPTGSGKSTSLPKHLSKLGRVMVSVPTRSSARNLSARMISLGIKAGYAAEGEVKYDQNTRLIYATSGHVRRKMLSYFRGGKLVRGGIDMCEILIVDEIHSGSVDNSIILALWSEAYKSLFGGSQDINVPRLILMTATPIPISMKPQPVKIDTGLDKTPYEIKVVYTRDYKNDGEKIKDMVAYIKNYHEAYDINTGHMLAFLPGKAQVEQVMNDLKVLKLKNCLLIPAYGSIEKEEMDKIYNKVSDSIRKIIVATNVAESSITIEGLGFVFDSMAEKRPSTSSSGGLKLTSHLISKKSADQRKGRTGRTKPGICVRFISTTGYDKLEDSREPDINIVPIHNEILEIINSGIDPSSIIENSEKVRMVLNELKKMEMVDDKMTVTESGKFSTKVPLSVRQSSFLWKWIKAKHNKYEGCVLATVVDSDFKNIFRRDNDYKDYEMSNRLVTCLSIMSEILKVKQRELKAWCIERNFSYYRVIDILNFLKNLLKSFKGEITKVDFDPESLYERASGILIGINKDMIMRREKGNNKFNMNMGFMFKLSSYDIPGLMENYDTLVALDHIVIESAGGYKVGIVNIAIPFEEKEIVEEIPDLTIIKIDDQTPFVDVSVSREGSLGPSSDAPTFGFKKIEKKEDFILQYPGTVRTGVKSWYVGPRLNV